MIVIKFLIMLKKSFVNFIFKNIILFVTFYIVLGNLVDLFLQMIYSLVKFTCKFLKNTLNLFFYFDFENYVQI